MGEWALELQPYVGVNPNFPPFLQRAALLWVLGEELNPNSP